MIKKKVKKMYYDIVIKFFSKNSRHKKKFSCDRDYKKLLEQLCQFIRLNSNTEYIIIEKKTILNSDVTEKWVGAQAFENAIIGIPNSETRIINFKEEFNILFKVKNGKFKWTGGCIWDNHIYAFPRTSDSFLSFNSSEISEIPIGFKYNGEHHYSGVCTRDGVVYQPPRNTNHILKTDLKNSRTSKIDIVNNVFKIKLTYCGSIIHPNGYIYFFPQNLGRIIKLDPKTDEWIYIGNKIATSCFDAKIGFDGNIYGFSAYNNGIMKIEVSSDLVQIIHENISFGAFGTKVGVDGCLYSVPGDNSIIYKFDIFNNEVVEYYDLKDGSKAKFAGGTITKDGVIYCSPATSNSILMYKPSEKIEIPEILYTTFFIDNY